MDPAGLLKEEVNRVFDLYSAQARSFRRSLNWLLMVSVAVFALFVVPFLGFSVQLVTFRQDAIVAEAKRIENEALLEQRREELESMSALLRLAGSYEREAMAYGTYQKLIAQGRERLPFMMEKRAEYLDNPSELISNWAKGEVNTLPEEAHRLERYIGMGVSDQCDWRLNDNSAAIADYAACRSCASFQDVNNSAMSRLKRLSIENLSDNVGPDILNGIVERACEFLEGGVDHWAERRPLPPDPTRIRRYLRHDVRAYSEALRELGKELSALLPNKGEEIEALEVELEAAQKKETATLVELERLGKFDKLATPFGDVPITLNQLALLFPIAVAVGFLIVAAAFGRMATLRSEFGRLSSKLDGEAVVMDATYLNAVAPIWLNRNDGVSATSLKWAILLTPAVLIVATCALIWRTDTFAETFPEGSAISSQIYVVLYTASLVLVAGGIFYIWKSARLNDP